MTRPTLLVLYHARERLAREAAKDHMLCWKRHFPGNTVYINIAFGLPKGINNIPFSATLLHTSLFKPRWSLDVFDRMMPLFESISRLPSPRIAMPQDEFLASEPLSKALVASKIDVVLTCAEDKDQALIYEHLIDERPLVKFETVLTGYLSRTLIRDARKFMISWHDRDYSIGQRVWDVPFWLGRRGRLKSEICFAALKIAQIRGWSHSISVNAAKTLDGQAWYKFLGNCKATVGAAGGASTLDRDGTIRACTERQPKKLPYNQVEKNCFPKADGELSLSCISPRHLEAAALGCVQVLVEGTYNGILIAGRHYIAVKPDFSNLEAALEQALTSEEADRLTSNALRDIAQSDKYSYSTFVSHVTNKWVLGEADIRPTDLAFRLKRNIANNIQWHYLIVEQIYATNKKVLFPLRLLVRPLQAIIGRPIS